MFSNFFASICSRLITKTFVNKIKYRQKLIDESRGAPDKSNTYLKISDAAKVLKISVPALRYLADCKEISCLRKPPRGNRWFKNTDVIALQKRLQLK